jgi:hypothetical protein
MFILIYSKHVEVDFRPIFLKDQGITLPTLNTYVICIPGVPLPLATKIYRCQTNSQLRFELNQIYYGACEGAYLGHHSNLASIQENAVVNSHATSCINSLHGAESNTFVQTKVGSIYHFCGHFYSFLLCVQIRPKSLACNYIYCISSGI